ncbi:MAG: dTDP-4-dehydrorhamnose 3,5-epimerase [Flavobacteriales bacterium]|nr:dTDP-4-dehydrorhamnose 3,5-epimerase [Bacteroidota bacterium]MCB9240109.1 dTDP-4-dehydrorhamnose 3,5-epimerase [Flavobacteriales bacterium]
MEILNVPISGLKVILPKVFGDHRGYFFESYNETAFQNAGLPTHFVQDNQSMSHKGALRGMHFQIPPGAQGKLVRVIQGSVLDVVIDIRKSSPTYGKHFAIELSGENKKMFWIPEGFAHGFLTLEDNTIFSYKCTDVYRPDLEMGLPWDDAELQIDWGVQQPLLSEKDTQHRSFSGFNSPFI